MQAAYCLYVLTEDERTCTKKLVLPLIDEVKIKLLVDTIAAGVHRTKVEETQDVQWILVLCSGVLYNLQDALPTEPHPDVPCAGAQLNGFLLPVLTRVCADVDMVALLEASLPLVTAVVEQDNLQQDARMDEDDMEEEKSRGDTKEDVLLARLEETCRVVQFALELMANICTQVNASTGPTEEEEDEWEEEEGDEEEEEAEEEEVEEEVEEVEILKDSNDVDPLQDAQQSINDSTRSFLAQQLLPLLRTVAESIAFYAQHTASLLPAQVYIEGLYVIQRALVCVNNYFVPWSVSNNTLDAWFDQNQVNSWWQWSMTMLDNAVTTLQHLDAPTNGMDKRHLNLREEWRDVSLNALTAVVAFSWTLARGGHSTLNVQQAHLEGMMAVYNSFSSDRHLAASLTGLLGALAQRRPGFIPQNHTITEWLWQRIHTACTSPSDYGAIQQAIEALDAVFDIFADKSYDYDSSVFLHNQWPQRLSSVQLSFKRLVKGIDRRKEKDLREQGDLALTNLTAFLHYKQNEYT